MFFLGKWGWKKKKLVECCNIEFLVISNIGINGFVNCLLVRFLKGFVYDF